MDANRQSSPSRRAGIRSALPEIDSALCTGCGLCARVCLLGNITMEDGRPVVRLSGPFGCIACGQCAAVCARGAVRVKGRRMSPTDSFPLSPRSKRATAEALEALLRGRRSTRRFRERPVERETIDRLLEMASSAPMGFPPSDVGVTVVAGRESVRELAADVTKELEKWRIFATPAGRALMRLLWGKAAAGTMRDLVLPLAAWIVEAAKRGEDLLLYDAPCVLLFHYPAKDTIDPAIACSFATVAAEAMGLGSCIIGTVAPALRERKLRAKWGIPAGNHPALAMILGYAEVAYSRGVRRGFASVRYL